MVIFRAKYSNSCLWICVYAWHLLLYSLLHVPSRMQCFSIYNKRFQNKYYIFRTICGNNRLHSSWNGNSNGVYSIVLASGQPFCQLNKINYNCVENFAKLKGFALSHKMCTHWYTVRKYTWCKCALVCTHYYSSVHEICQKLSFQTGDATR